MQDLEVGEEIASGFLDGVSLHFSKVIAFLHRDEQMKTIFVKLEIENGKVLLLTKTHLIFRYGSEATNKTFLNRNILFGNCEAIHAENVHIGDFVYTSSSKGNVSLSKVSAITFVELNGVFAPLTEAGTIIVDDIYVSCYAIVSNHDLAHAVFFPMRFFDQIYSLYLESIFRYLFGYTSVFLDENISIVNVENVRRYSNTYVHGYARFLWCVKELFTTYCE